MLTGKHTGVQFQTENELIEEKFFDLLSKCTRCNRQEDKELLEKAFKVAHDAHKGTKRKSGEPYILHPLAVAKIVNQEIGLGAKSMASALLHDVVEDTDYTIEDIENLFGEKIANIIEGLTKIPDDLLEGDASKQAENFRKMLLTLSDDVRVILIKLADRLHNMRTLESMPRQKQIKIAGETVYLYAPLAHRLGLYSIKTELEDLSLKYRYPRIYDEIVKKLRDSERKRLNFINRFSLPIIERLSNHGLSFDINGRPKSIYSIWDKMQKKGVTFESIYDIFAIRIVFEPKADIDEKTQCWNIYSLITDIYPPKPERIRDWISTPKANGYEALHITLMGPEGKWVEVQIRSRRMDEIAERGFAAHWKYKNSSIPSETELDRWIKKMRDLLSTPQSDAIEFLDEFKLNLFTSEIQVFTPKGKLITMPKGSSALDFAYEIHSEIGNKAIGAKVNHKLLPVSHVLHSGDQVEIITSRNAKPKTEWFEFVKTAKAKSAIKNAFKAETKNRIELGKQSLEEKLLSLKLHPTSRILRKLLPAYEVTSKEELYSKVGMGIIKLDDLKKILRRNTKSKIVRYWELSFGSRSTKKQEQKPLDVKKTLVINDEIRDPESQYLIAKCCSPIPGDDVIGYIDPDGLVHIHQTKCSNAVRLMSNMGDKIIPVKWTTHKILSFHTRIHITGFDRFGVYSDIINVISKELNVNIRNINLTSHDGIFDGTIDVYVHSLKDINNLIMNLIKQKGVDTVHRVENVEDE